MKRILITGKSSYVGTSLAKWLGQYPSRYSVDTISLRSEQWERVDFSGYDVVFHVAGIAHVSTNSNLKQLYFQVNRDLTVQVAKKSKLEGVKQFIFMSSIIVYGDSRLTEELIDKDTIPEPSNYYGQSKLEAENGIRLIENEKFKVAILRPPMIYGKGSKGNYSKLSLLARKTPLFPNIENRRSIIFIDNLCELVRLLIDNNERGLFFPQNQDYVKTSDLVRFVAEVHNRNIRLTGRFNPIIRLFGNRVEILKKIFGNLAYEISISEYKQNYRVVNFLDSIKITELKQAQRCNVK